MPNFHHVNKGLQDATDHEVGEYFTTLKLTNPVLGVGALIGAYTNPH